MFVTTEYLRSLDACEEQLEVFASVFPNGAEVTRENLERALKAGLNLDWFGQYVMGEPYLVEMAIHDFEYNEKTGDITEAYSQAGRASSGEEELDAALQTYRSALDEAAARLRSAMVETILNLLSKE